MKTLLPIFIHIEATQKRAWFTATSNLEYQEALSSEHLEILAAAKEQSTQEILRWDGTPGV